MAAAIARRLAYAAVAGARVPSRAKGGMASYAAVDGARVWSHAKVARPVPRRFLSSEGKAVQEALERGINKAVEEALERGINKAVEEALERGINKVEGAVERGISKAVESTLSKLPSPGSEVQQLKLMVTELEVKLHLYAKFGGIGFAVLLGAAISFPAIVYAVQHDLDETKDDSKKVADNMENRIKSLEAKSLSPAVQTTAAPPSATSTDKLPPPAATSAHELSPPAATSAHELPPSL